MPAPTAVEAPVRRPARRPRPTVPAPERTRPAARRNPSARTGILGGVLWIVVLAALLAGVVAVNVALLRLNVRLDDLAQQRTELRRENAAVAKRLASADSQVERLARHRLKLVPASPDATTYVRLGKKPAR